MLNKIPKRVTIFKATLLILLISLFFISCSKSTPQIPADWQTYSSEKYAFSLGYPKLYTLEENENAVTIYHFRQQPVPYFTITVSEESPDDILKSWDGKILKDETVEKFNLKGRLVVAEDQKSKNSLETYFFTKENLTYYFSCYGETYEDICNTIEIK